MSDLPAPQPRTRDPGSDLVKHFRSDRKRPPLHPREKAVLSLVTLHLCFLPWALGTMHAWSQLTNLGLSLGSLLLALRPRDYSADQTGGPAFRLSAWPRLVRFPLFWLGLALLAYLAIQGFNPSWVWERNATTWWLRRVNDIPWLPTSVETPFARFNLWRQFIIYASAWLTVCTIWIGFTRRRSLQILLTALLVNAVILAIIGFALRVLNPTSFFGLYDWPIGASAFASFIYKNHAGAYFALATALTIAVALWTHESGARSGRKSSPASVLLFAALLLGAAVLASHSRGATITVAVFLLLMGLWFYFRSRVFPAGPGGNRIVTLALMVVFAAALLGTARYLDFSVISDRFNVLAKDPAGTMEGRLLAYRSGETMLADHWLWGVGAGGFRYLYPEYIKHHPAIYEEGHLFWDHIHRDWLEIPIELGAAGSLLLVMAGGYWVVFFSRHRAAWHVLAMPLLLGCGQTLIHAWFDFPFQCPAILVTWLALMTVAARWLEVDAA